MERNDTVKLLGILIFLGWLLIGLLVFTRQMKWMFSGFRLVDPPTWYEIALQHPGLYLGIGAAVVIGFVVWQICRREVALGRLLRIDHDDSVWTYWSILAGELAAAALLVHLTIFSVINT